MPALVEVTAPVVLVRVPPVAVTFTFTLNVHELLAAIVAPVKLTLPDAAVAVIVPPPQVPVNPLGVATTSPVGNASVNATPVSAAVFAAGLVIANVRVVLPLTIT